MNWRLIFELLGDVAGIISIMATGWLLLVIGYALGG